MRAIAHVDADCFFASVEVALRPELVGKPVLVCSRTDERGIVLAATYEARRPGIRAGTPLFKARPLCPEGIYIKSHFHLYEEASHKIMSILRRFTPDVQPCSVDEAFIDLTGLRILYKTNYVGIATAIKQTIKKEVGINVSIGIASSRLLAKMASDGSKPNGLLLISERSREDFLRKTPASAISGIGPNTTAYLKKLGIYTAYDIVTTSYIPSSIGKHLREVKDALEGKDDAPIIQDDRPQKSLSCTRTFPTFSDDEKYIYEFSLSLLVQACRKLRLYNLEAHSLHFFLVSKDFKYKENEERFLSPTNDEEITTKAFQELFRSCFQKNIVYRKAGIIFPTLIYSARKQLSLFEDTSGLIAQEKLFNSIDQLQAKYGFGIVKKGTFIRKPSE